MKWIDQNQAVVELDASTTHSNHGPLRAVVGRYSRYQDEVMTLDVIEIIRLRVIAEFIIESFAPGCLPILGIHVVGHADSDFQRGPKFEKAISENRALKVKQYLKTEIDKRTFSVVVPPPDIPTPARINWYPPRGVGAAQPDEENVKRRKTPQNMTEEDRARNRRVAIILEPGDVPVQNANEWVNKIIFDYTRRRLPLPPLPPSPSPKPLPPWMWDPKVLPKPGDFLKWNEFLEAAENWFKAHHLDIDPFLDVLKNLIFPDNKWPLDEDFLKELRRRGLIPVR